MCIYIYMYIHILHTHTHVYIYIYIEREREIYIVVCLVNIVLFVLLLMAWRSLRRCLSRPAAVLRRHLAHDPPLSVPLSLFLPPSPSLFLFLSLSLSFSLFLSLSLSLQGISLYNVFPCIRDFPLQGVSPFSASLFLRLYLGASLCASLSAPLLLRIYLRPCVSRFIKGGCSGNRV